MLFFSIAIHEYCVLMHNWTQCKVILPDSVMSNKRHSPMSRVTNCPVILILKQIKMTSHQYTVFSVLFFMQQKTDCDKDSIFHYLSTSVIIWQNNNLFFLIIFCFLLFETRIIYFLFCIFLSCKKFHETVLYFVIWQQWVFICNIFWRNTFFVFYFFQFFRRFSFTCHRMSPA